MNNHEGTQKQAFQPFDEPPVLQEYILPEYPELAREAGIEGTVRIKVLVGINGQVLHTEIIDSNVTPAMEKAALEAAKNCVFTPAKNKDKVVQTHVVMPFHFRLN